MLESPKESCFDFCWLRLQKVYFCFHKFIPNTLPQTEAFAKRDVNATAFDALQKNMDDFRNCIDKSLANVVGEVNEDHLKPLFSVVSDQLNRFSKAVSLTTSSDDITVLSVAC